MARRAGQPRTRNGRVYGSKHRRWAAILPSPIGKPCPRCMQPMLKGQSLHLGHTVDAALGGEDSPRRWEHASCNLRAGGRLGRARQLARQREQQQSYMRPDICDQGQAYMRPADRDIHTEDW